MMGVAIGPSDTTRPGTPSQTVNGNYGFATSKLNLYPPGNTKNPAPNHDLARCTPATLRRQTVHERAGPDRPQRLHRVGRHPERPGRRQADVQGDHRGGRQHLRRRHLPAAAELPADDAGQAERPGRTAGRPRRCRPASRRRSRPASSRRASVRCTRCNVTDPTFLAGGGSPFEGQDRPYCTDKLVTRPRRSGDGAELQPVHRRAAARRTSGA